MERAEQLLLEALGRDPNNSMAHTAMGQLRRVQNRLAESRIECETAIALERNNALAIYRLGTALMWLGQPDAGIPYIEKAIRLALSRQRASARKGARPGQSSRRCNGVLPLRCRFGSEDPQRRSGDEVPLKVEIVVNGGVHAEKVLGRSG